MEHQLPKSHTGENEPGHGQTRYLEAETVNAYSPWEPGVEVTKDYGYLTHPKI